MQNQAIHLLMKYELSKSTDSYFSVLLNGEKLNFSLREFGLITGLNCVNKFSDYGYTSTYVSHLMTTYFSNKQRVEKWHLKNVVTNKAWANDEDAVRLCILYLLEFFVCPSDKEHVSFIDKFMFFLIESALQVWLYECCSSVSTELATRCSESIPRILRWSATKGQIWLTAIEEKMIKPEWLKFTSITESGEETGVLNLPDKIQYEDAHGAQSSQVPIAASPTFEPKDTDCQKDTESVISKLKKLEKAIEQVDGKLAEFRKAVFEELSSLRQFIDVSVKSVMKVINRRYDVDESKFVGSSTKNNDQQQGENNRQFQFNIGDQVHASTSNTAYVDLYPDFQEAAGAYKAAEVSTEHLQAHVEEEPEFEGVAEAQQASEVSPGGVPAMVEEEPGFHEGAEVEKADIEDNVPQSPIHGMTVNEVVPEGSGIDKKGPTLDDFELPDNLTQLVMYGKPIPDEATPIHPGENVDADLIERFTNWLYLRSDKVSKRRKEYFSKKDNQIKPWLDFGCEKHIDVIMYYLRKRGKYGPNNDTRFTTIDYLFRTKIERIYDKVKSSPPELKYSVVKSDDDVAEYILGYRLLDNVVWDVVDYVIMPVDKFSIIIPLYLSCTGFYGKRNDIDFKTTKAYIEKPVTDPFNIQWMVAEIPQQKEGSLDCGVFVAAFAEYVSLGDLAIQKEDLSDIDQHRRRYGALRWDYATKKQEDGSISESEVTGRLVKRKCAPAKNERTRVQRKKK
ncbi:uncharacterized protein [Nicotiana sylvestris]|uniref:uncharacterized protein n=1 Tax=Nicotiana sylvestris TaxID=4096 RepID=UPI00388CD4C6